MIIDENYELGLTDHHVLPTGEAVNLDDRTGWL